MPFRYPLGLLCLLAALVVGCSGSAPPRTGEPLRSLTAEDVAGVFEAMLSTSPPPTEAALVSRLGPPVRTRMAAEGASPADSMRTLVYHGMEFMVPAVPGAPLGRMALTDARYTSPEDLRVGYDRDAVWQALGPPAQETTTEMIYAKPGPPACTLVVYLEGRKVSRLEWVFDR